MERLDELALAMTAYYEGAPKEIQHFLKVHAFAELIGKQEDIDRGALEILEAAAYVHDIGIKPSLEKYGNCLGPNQEKEGIGPAREILEKTGFPEHVVERVVFLVGHHHTYEGIDDVDWQILLEADYLVNAFEGKQDTAAVRKAYDGFFRTDAGRRLLVLQFPDIL